MTIMFEAKHSSFVQCVATELLMCEYIHVSQIRYIASVAGKRLALYIIFYCKDVYANSLYVYRTLYSTRALAHFTRFDNDTYRAASK